MNYQDLASVLFNEFRDSSVDVIEKTILGGDRKVAPLSGTAEAFIVQENDDRFNEYGTKLLVVAGNAKYNFNDDATLFALSTALYFGPANQRIEGVERVSIEYTGWAGARFDPSTEVASVILRIHIRLDQLLKQAKPLQRRRYIGSAVVT